jgi:hypothetical protein
VKERKKKKKRKKKLIRRGIRRSDTFINKISTYRQSSSMHVTLKWKLEATDSEESGEGCETEGKFTYFFVFLSRLNVPMWNMIHHWAIYPPSVFITYETEERISALSEKVVQLSKNNHCHAILKFFLSFSLTHTHTQISFISLIHFDYDSLHFFFVSPISLSSKCDVWESENVCDMAGTKRIGCES